MKALHLVFGITAVIYKIEEVDKDGFQGLTVLAALITYV